MSSAYIAAVKDELRIAKQFSRKDSGIATGKRHECPPENHNAIVDAFRHFKMIDAAVGMPKA